MGCVSEVMTEGQYLPVTELPGVAKALQEVREDAQKTIQEREALIANGRHEEVPLAIDALSTADEVINARNEHGVESPEFQEKRAALDLDCLRLVAEWYRKKRPEYFPESRHYFDANTGDFYSHGLSIRQMTENALRPIHGNAEEEGRRINERVEDETPSVIQQVGGFALGECGIRLRTISECTDKAISDYENDMKNGSKHAGYDGYVPEIEKVMIRDMRIDPETGDRIEEQVGLVGKLSINHWVIQEALRRRGVETRHMDKTQLHGTQMLVNDDLIDFVRLLDDVAGEEWCTNIFMGERVDENHPKDYSLIREEARLRQEGLTVIAERTTSFILDLAEGEFDRHKAPAHIESFVKKLLLKEAKADRNIAIQMFDERTADGLSRVAHLESEGKMQEAFELFQEVEDSAPGGGYCSGGSCGLESVDTNSIEGKGLAGKVKAEAGDEVVRDKERKCKCGAKKIVYAYSKDKVNKYCESCNAFESKKTK